MGKVAIVLAFSLFHLTANLEFPDKTIFWWSFSEELVVGMFLRAFNLISYTILAVKILVPMILSWRRSFIIHGGCLLWDEYQWLVVVRIFISAVFFGRVAFRVLLFATGEDLRASGAILSDL
jgi:hypothetical protein